MAFSCFSVEALCELAFILFQDSMTLLNLFIYLSGRMHRFDAEAGESPLLKKQIKIYIPVLTR